MAKAPFSQFSQALPTSASLELLLAEAPVDAESGLPLRRWTTRLPESVALEIEAIARVNALTVNALVMVALDDLLKKHGRPAMADLAPWFPAYLQRCGGGARKRRSPRSGGDFE